MLNHSYLQNLPYHYILYIFPTTHTRAVRMFLEKKIVSNNRQLYLNDSVCVQRSDKFRPRTRHYKVTTVLKTHTGGDSVLAVV